MTAAPASSATLHRLLIASPYGNRVSVPKTTAILGPWTVCATGGFFRFWWKAFTSWRYHWSLGAWDYDLWPVNPGIHALLRQVRLQPSLARRVAASVLSVTGGFLSEWSQLASLALLVRPLALELDWSLPLAFDGVVEPVTAFRVVSEILDGSGIPIIVKLPAINYEPPLEAALSLGWRNFHVGGPLPWGHDRGLSGKPLQRLHRHTIGVLCRYLRSQNIAPGWIIGSGGIGHISEARAFLRAGATHVAVGSSLLDFPFLHCCFWWRHRRWQRLAEQLSGPPRPGPLRVKRVEQIP